MAEVQNLLQRLWARSVQSGSTGCWLWQGPVNKDGYGRITVNGQTKLVHCVAWELTHGRIPPRRFVLHRCDMPACWRPDIDHLFLGTKGDNAQDANKKGRLYRPWPGLIRRHSSLEKGRQAMEVLTIRQAAKCAQVSPNKLYRAISANRLSAALGGGPGKPSLISWEELQRWCASERLPAPVKPAALERVERSTGAPDGSPQDSLPLQAPPDVAALMAQQAERFERFIAQAIDRAVDQVVERLAERLTAQAIAHPQRSVERSLPAIAAPKAAVLKRLRVMQAEGLSLQAMANRFNNEGVPTLSGKGRWQKGTISNLLAQGEEQL